MQRPRFSFPTLYRRDQRVLAVIVLVCLPFLVWEIPRTTRFDKTVDRSYRFQVDLGCASATELRLLPGIGEKLADAIILERTQRAPFKTFAEIKRVKGVGPKKFEAMQPFLENDTDERRKP